MYYQVVFVTSGQYWVAPQLNAFSLVNALRCEAMGDTDETEGRNWKKKLPVCWNVQEPLNWKQNTHWQMVMQFSLGFDIKSDFE